MLNVNYYNLQSNVRHKKKIFSKVLIKKKKKLLHLNQIIWIYILLLVKS